MSGKGKRKDEQDYASDGDSEGHVHARKTAKKDSDDSDGIVVCEISKNRRVSVRNWQGNIVVDIREFYVKDGKQMPGKKATEASLYLTKYYKCVAALHLYGTGLSISLNMAQWNVLRNHVEEIDKAVNENS